MKKTIAIILTTLVMDVSNAQTFQKYIKSSGNAAYPGWYSNAIGYDPTTSSIFIEADQHNGIDAPAGLIKVDTCGNVLWARYTTPQGSSFGASGTYYNGGFSVMNRTSGSSAGGFITSILNYDGNGNLLSTNGVNTGASSVVDLHLVSSKRLPNGDIIATGYGPVTNHFKDIVYCRMNSTGNVIWSKYSGQFDTFWENGWGCDYDPVNLDCYFVGQNISFSQTNSTDIHVIKTDINGNTLWIKNIATPFTDVGWCVKVLPNQDVVVIANTTNNSASNEEISFIKLSASGNLITSCKYQATGVRNVIRNVNILPNGNLLLTGYTNSFGAGGLDCLNMEVDLNGNIIWQKAYGSSDDDFFLNAVFFNNCIFSAGARDFGNTAGTGYQLYLVKSKLDGTMSSPGCNVTNGGFVKLAENYTIFNVNNVTPSGFNIPNNFVSNTVNTTQTVLCGKPTASFTPPTPICANQVISLTNQSLGANSWTWTSTGNNISTPNTLNQTNITFTAGGTYTVQLKVANCVGVDSIKKVIVVNPNPTITPTSNAPLCAGATLSLNVGGAVTYSWSGPSSFSSNQQNPVITNVQSVNSGVYSVSVTSASGCVSGGTLNAIVSSVPNPIITPVGNNPLCIGNSLNLNASGASSYTWMPGASNNTSITVSPTASITYTLLASNPGTGCSNTAVYSITVNPSPSLAITGTSIICNGQSTTLNVSGSTSYTWSNGSNSSSISVTPTITTSYSVIGISSSSSCNSVAFYNVIVNPKPLVVVNGNSSICNGQSTTLIASGANTYTWNTTSNNSNLNISPTQNTVYTVSGTNAFGCINSATFAVNVNAIPVVSATSATLCGGQTGVTLVASGATSYVWQPGNVTGSTYPYNGNASITVTVVGTSNGCSSSANAAILVKPAPNANISVSNVKGCVPACLTFSSSGSSSITSYGWILNGAGITGSVNGAYCFDEAASYTLGLTVMDNNGCTGTVVPVIIDVYPKPIADFNHAPIKPIINQDPFVTFTDASYGATIVSWNWYFMNTAQYTSIEQNPTFAYSEPGTYPVALVVRSDKGCLDTIVRPLVVGEDFGIYVPNAFTPNADGLNDVFQPKGFGIVKYEINIFDRWGEKVFHTNTFEEGWDGSFKGRGQKICEEGSYTWLINCTSVFGKSHELKGNVILMK